ncbi:hypothetical protein SS05631_c25840 [Sinorhizobium sp. CCBAU 05631]|nr:hypothetical protein SS05631_c25840 [Sinorhizobium sp. CCBAU 05631]
MGCVLPAHHHKKILNKNELLARWLFGGGECALTFFANG